MDMYKLMVVRWSIFILSIQLIYCASFYSNVDLPPMQPTESICKTDEKLYVTEREVESSLIYDLHPGDTLMPCKTVLSAPESNGFIVRLHKPKGRKAYGTTTRSKSETGGRIRNSTSCPLSIKTSTLHVQCQLRILTVVTQEENVSVLMPTPKMTIVNSTSLDAKRENCPSLTRGLSRYGPWGYLMLGMLLCGGALLICGLWECCFRHKEPTVPPDFDASTNHYSVADFNSVNVNSSTAGLPSSPQINYDEIHPPPSYAALFPNQKLTNDSNIVLYTPSPQVEHSTTLP